MIHRLGRKHRSGGVSGRCEKRSIHDHDITARTVRVIAPPLLCTPPFVIVVYQNDLKAVSVSPSDDLVARWSVETRSQIMLRFKAAIKLEAEADDVSEEGGTAADFTERS